MAFHVVNYLIGRKVAENAGVSDDRASQLALLSSGMVNVAAPVGIAMTSAIAQREASALAATSTSADPPDVPDVVGMASGEAVVALVEVGYSNVHFEHEPSTADEEGVVLEQFIEASEDGPALDDPITLVIGAGPGSIVVPEVRSMYHELAQQVLEELGLQVEFTAQDAANGTCPGHVLRQQPPAGTEVEEGEMVRLEVAADPDGPEG